MPRVTLDFNVAQADADHAWSHSYDGRVRAIAAVPMDAERFGGTTAPSSSVWADLRDIAAARDASSCRSATSASD